MDNQFDLTVHDTTVQDTTSFGLGNQVKKGKRVTYWVGSHGPFILTYDAADATTARIISDIDAQVQQLRELSAYGK